MDKRFYQQRTDVGESSRCSPLSPRRLSNVIWETLLQIVFAISLNQAFQASYGEAQLSAALTICHPSGLLPFPHNRPAGHDIGPLLDSRLSRLKMMMSRNEGPQRFENQREAVVSVGLGESSVNRDGLAASFQWGLAFLDLYGNVAVDDHARGRINSEFGQDLIAKPGFVDQPKVRVFRLMVRARVGEEIALESCDAILAEQGRARAAPEIPEQVHILQRSRR